MVAVATVALSCTDRQSNGLGLPFPAALAVAPAVSSIAGGPVFDLVSIRVRLTDYPGDKPVVDTILPLSTGDSTVRLALAVQLMRPSQDFYLRIAAVDVLGDTLFRSADTVTIRQNEASPAPATVELRYSGPDTLVAAVSLSPRDTTILVGVPLLMRPTAIGIDQSVLKGVRFGWRTSQPSALTVTPDGTVLALAPVQGAWIVATTANGRMDSTQISTAVTSQSLRVTPDTATLGVGATLPLSVVALDSGGIQLPVPAPLVWSSEDTRIATVSLTGAVTGLTPGTTRIFAAAGTLRGEMRVNVVLVQ